MLEAQVSTLHVEVCTLLKQTSARILPTVARQLWRKSVLPVQETLTRMAQTLRATGLWNGLGTKPSSFA